MPDVDVVRELAANFDSASPAMSSSAERPFDVYKVLRETSPVLYLSRGNGFMASVSDGPWWVLSRLDDIASVFHDDEHFTSGRIMGFLGPDGIPQHDFVEDVPLGDIDKATLGTMMQRIPMGLDPPEFFAYRRILTPLHSPSKARSLEHQATQLINVLLDGFIESGCCDFVEDLAVPFPGVLTCQILGLPPERWRWFASGVSDFVEWAREAPEHVGAGATARDIQTQFGMFQVPQVLEMLRIADERRHAPRDDMITDLTGLTIDGRSLNRYEVGGMLSILLSGGIETTTAALGSALVYLGRHPDTRQRLIGDPALIPGFVEEVLRMFPPLMEFTRMATKPTVIDGHQIAPGDGVSLLIGSANRDPEHFPNPDEFVFDRSPNRHITFTVGVHRCLGSNFARMELRVSLEQILRRIPDFTLDEDQTSLYPALGQSFRYASARAVFAPSGQEAV